MASEGSFADDDSFVVPDITLIKTENEPSVRTDEKSETKKGKRTKKPKKTYPEYKLTEDQRLRYNKQKEDLRKKRLATETPEEREERITKRRLLMRTYWEKRYANETPEEREKRLEDSRAKMKKVRAERKKKREEASGGEPKKKPEKASVGVRKKKRDKASIGEVREEYNVKQEEEEPIATSSGWWSDNAASDNAALDNTAIDNSAIDNAESDNAASDNDHFMDEEFLDEAIEESTTDSVIKTPIKIKPKKPKVTKVRVEKYLDPETLEKQKIAKTYRTRHKLKVEASNVCYFCLRSLEDGKNSIFNIKNKIEEYGPKIVTSDIIPNNICSECLHEVTLALDTYDMIVQSQKYWDAVLQKIGLSKDEQIRNEPKLFVETVQAIPKVVMKETNADFDNFFDHSETYLVDNSDQNAKETTNDDSEIQFLCRICMIGCIDAAAATVHAMVEHKIVNKRMIGAQIISHRTMKDTENPFCVKCWAEFDSESELITHKQSCRVPLKDQQFTPGWQKPFECEKCGQKYSAREALVRHYDFTCYKNQEKINKLKRPCPDCGKVFASEQMMRAHQKAIHSENRQTHICERCGKEYLVLKSLEMHRLTCDASRHEKLVRAFSCTACFKTFTGQDRLQAHMNRVHAQSRQTFSCRICSKGFYLNRSRLFHESRIHGKARNFACKICGKEFFILYDLKNHARTFHNVNPVESEFKEKILKQISGEEKQKRLKTVLEKVQCDLCGDKFPNEELLEQHKNNNCEDLDLNISTFGPNPSNRHTCESCHRWFKSRDRLDSHYSRGCEDDDPPLAALYQNRLKAGNDVKMVTINGKTFQI